MPNNTRHGGSAAAQDLATPAPPSPLEQIIAGLFGRRTPAHAHHTRDGGTSGPAAGGSAIRSTHPEKTLIYVIKDMITDVGLPYRMYWAAHIIHHEKIPYISVKLSTRSTCIINIRTCTCRAWRVTCKARHATMLLVKLCKCEKVLRESHVRFVGIFDSPTLVVFCHLLLTHTFPSQE